MPAWAAKAPVLVYVTNRSGPNEIWLHGPGDSDRPLISATDGSTSEDRWLMGPALSSDGSRVIYTVINRSNGAITLWMASVSGGAPVRLTNDQKASEFAGSWSPDGVWFVYQAMHNGKSRSDESPPERLRQFY